VDFRRGWGWNWLDVAGTCDLVAARRRRRVAEIQRHPDYEDTSRCRRTQKRYGRKPSLPGSHRIWCGRSGARLLREKDYFPAMGTLGEVRKALDPLMLGEHTFDERVERIRVGVRSGM
jgi:hypothetical protein